jgi:hypothetical protein
MLIFFVFDFFFFAITPPFLGFFYMSDKYAQVKNQLKDNSKKLFGVYNRKVILKR